MSDRNHKGIGIVVDLIDSSISGIYSGLGLISALFFAFLPLILIMAGIKWLFANGYIG